MAAKQKLIIVESPAKARTISRYLGKGWKVEASQGHVRDLPKSQLGVDVDNDFDMKYITIRGRGEILSRIRKEAKTASTIYLATDPDREGEAISWHLAHILGIDVNKPCRIEFHEVTKKAIKDAIASPRLIDMRRVDAQQARRALDRLVGYKISPLLWAKVRKGLSAGRVQSVATRMVVMREQEIEAFMPEEYWDITAQGQVKGAAKKSSMLLHVVGVDGHKAELNDEAQATGIAKRMENAAFAVSSVRRGEKKRMPAPPFTTSSLQQEASRKLGFTTAKTMQVVQQLYEGVDIEGEGTQGLVTYIRTDSVRISDEAMAALRAFIPEEYGADFLPEAPHEYKGRKNAQDAHEAIRPTDIMRSPDKVKESLNRDQYKLYRLIYCRFIASQMNPALYDTLSADIEGDGVTLRYTGEHKRFKGFTAVYEESTDDAETVSDEAHLPQFAEGDEIVVSDIDPQQHFTQPPTRYTEASLVRALEEKGIGRPSTYAPTITTIISRGYVSREKKRIYPTEMGRMVTAMMEEYFPDIVNLDFTAELEEHLDDVEDQGMEWKQLLREFYPGFEETLEKAESQIDKVHIEAEVSDEPCENCGALLVYKMGRFGKFLACPNFPECRFTKPIVTYIAAPCPKCGKRLMEKISKKNRKFYGCEGYPECDFTSWEKPIEQRCPQCGSYMVEKYARSGNVYLCANETCRYREKAPEQEGAEDENE